MKTIKFAALALSAGLVSQTASADVFFSEYLEGSSYNKALEIFNDTGAAVDLSDYVVKYYFNGKTSVGTSINLSGSLASGDVFVLTNYKASDDILNLADFVHNSTVWFNGNDAIELYNGSTLVDSIGQVGNDGYWGKDNTLRRFAAPDLDSSNAFDASQQWEEFAKNDISDLGQYTAPVSEPATIAMMLGGLGLVGLLANRRKLSK